MKQYRSSRLWCRRVAVGDRRVQGVGDGELSGERFAWRFDREVADVVAVEQDAPALGDPEVVTSDFPLEAVEGPGGWACCAAAPLIELAAMAWACEADARGLGWAANVGAAVREDNEHSAGCEPIVVAASGVVDVGQAL
jgi:hypothetical protein